MSVGFNGLSTLLNHPTRRAHPINPHSSRYPALTFPALPPPDVLLPRDAPSIDTEGYVRSTKPVWRKLRRSAAPPSTENAEGPPYTGEKAPHTGGKEIMTPLDSVPQVFFAPDFVLSDPGYFERVFEVSATTPDPSCSGLSPAAIAQDAVDSIPPLLGEKLSFYSDVIEQHLVSALSERSEAILDAASSLQTLTESGRACATKTAALQVGVRTLDEDVAHTGAALLFRQHRRRRLQSLMATLERIQSVVIRAEGAEQLAHQRMWLDALQAVEQVRRSLQEPLVLASEQDAGACKQLKLSDIASLNALSTRLDRSMLQTSKALFDELQAALRDWIISSTTGSLLLDASGHAAPNTLDQTNTERLRVVHARRACSMRLSLTLAAEQLAAATAEATPAPGAESSPVATASPIQGTEALPSDDGLKQPDDGEDDQVNSRDKILLQTISPLLAALSQAKAVDAVPHALEQATLQALEGVAVPAWTAAHTPDTIIPLLATLVNRSEGQGKATEPAVAYLRSLSAPVFLERSHVYLDTLLNVLRTWDKAVNLLSQSHGDVPQLLDKTSQVGTNIRSAAQAAAARLFAARGLVLESSQPAPSLADLEDAKTVWSDPELAAFLPPFQLGWGFMLRSRLPIPTPGCNTGTSGGSDVLRSTLLRLAREFVAAVHGRRLSAAAVAVEAERWTAKPVPSPVQDLVETILLGATEDPQQFMISPFEQEVAAPSTQAKSEAARDSKTLEIEGHRYFVVAASLLMLPQLGRYCRLVVNLPIICVEVLARLVEFLKQFNSRVCQLVLGAGALRSAGLTNINARHLALAEQSLSAVVGLLPYVRELVRRHLPKRMKLMLTEFDRLKQDYMDHRIEIQTKLVSILQERIAVHSRSLRVLNWEQAAEAEHRFRLQFKEKEADQSDASDPASQNEEARKEKESHKMPGQSAMEGPPQLSSLTGLLTDSSTLSTILSRYLPTGTLESIMRRAGASIDLHLADSIRSIDWDALDNPTASRSNGSGSARSSMTLSRTPKDFVRPEVTPRDAMRADLTRFVSHLHRLKGMGQWDPSHLLKLQDTVLAARPPPSTPRTSLQASRRSLSMTRDSPTQASPAQASPSEKLVTTGKGTFPLTTKPARIEPTGPSARATLKEAEPKRLGSPAPMIPTAANSAPPPPAPSPGPTIKYQPRQRPPRRRSSASPAPSPPPTGTMSPSIDTNLRRHGSASSASLSEATFSPAAHRPSASPVSTGMREFPITTSYVPRRPSSALSNQHSHLRAPSEPVRSSHSPLGSPVPPSPDSSPPRPSSIPAQTDRPLVTRPEPRRAIALPVTDDEDDSRPVLLARTGPSVHVTAPPASDGLGSDDSDDDIPLARRAVMMVKSASNLAGSRQAPSPLMETTITESPVAPCAELPDLPASASRETVQEAEANYTSTSTPPPSATEAPEATSAEAGSVSAATLIAPAPIAGVVPPPTTDTGTGAETSTEPVTSTEAEVTQSTASPNAMLAPAAGAPSTSSSAPASASSERRNKRLSLKERLAEATRKRASLSKSSHAPGLSISTADKASAPTTPPAVSTPLTHAPISTSAPATASAGHTADAVLEAGSSPPRMQPRVESLSDAVTKDDSVEGAIEGHQEISATSESTPEPVKPSATLENRPVTKFASEFSSNEDAAAQRTALDYHSASSRIKTLSAVAASPSAPPLQTDASASEPADTATETATDPSSKSVLQDEASETAEPNAALGIAPGSADAATSVPDEAVTVSDVPTSKPDERDEGEDKQMNESEDSQVVASAIAASKQGELEMPAADSDPQAAVRKLSEPVTTDPHSFLRAEAGAGDPELKQKKDSTSTPDPISTETVLSATPTPESEPPPEPEAALDGPDSELDKTMPSKEEKEREKRRRKKKAQRQRRKK